MNKGVPVIRTKEGLANARAKGKRLGRPRALNECQAEKARRMVEAGMSLRFVAGEMEVSRDALRRALNAIGGAGA